MNKGIFGLEPSALNLLYTDFDINHGGPLKAEPKIIFSDMIKSELSFCGEISRITVVKLFKPMTLNIVIKMEEIVEEPDKKLPG